jgi:hypothetical protein
LAGFEVTLIGRFWVTPEVMTDEKNAAQGSMPERIILKTNAAQ